MKLPAYNHQGKALEAWSLTLPLGEVKQSLLAQALRVYQSNSHQGGSRVKSRGEVQGSTRKIYRQKGTGRARHGARSAPIFVGGGVSHGPTGLRAQNLVLPKKMRRQALATALTLKFENRAIAGLETVDKLDSKTAAAANLLGKIAGHPQHKTLVISGAKPANFFRAARNLQGVTFKSASLVNAYDLVAADFVLVTKDALDPLLTRLANKAYKSTNPNT